MPQPDVDVVPGAGGGRLLFVHAHPDDETLATGLTLAASAAAGHRTVLVTCTRGEEGEVLVPHLAHLAAGRDDRLGPHREVELRAALAALGVTEHHYLDRLVAAPPGHRPTWYRDSGMSYAPDGSATWAEHPRPEAFALAPVDAPAARLAALVGDLRPHVVVTYEPGGGYGHPDHVQAHRVTMRAVALAAASGAWRVPKVYWVVMPRTVLQAQAGVLRGAPDAPPLAGFGGDGPEPSVVVDDASATTVVRAPHVRAARAAALRAHATQVAPSAPHLRIADDPTVPFGDREYFRLVHGAPAGPFDADGRETDLLAGLDLQTGAPPAGAPPAGA